MKLTLLYEDEGDIILPIEAKLLAEKVICEVLSYEQCPYQVEINLLLTTNQEIQAMNAEFRGIDTATDVLSFPAIAFEEAGEFEFLTYEERYFHPESGELILGDIAISKEKVLEQAKEYGHSTQREFAFLIVHSMLHLIGYDHINEEERLIMESRQREIMSRLNILRAN